METIPPLLAPYPLPTVPASRRDTARTRLRILETAREVVAVRGADVSLADVASFGGLSPRTVRRHFPTRESLVHTLYDEALTELAQLAEEAADHRDPLLGLLDFLTRSAPSPALQCGLHELVLTDEVGQLAADRARDRLLPGLSRLIDRVRGTGALPADFQPADLPTLGYLVSNVTEYAENIEPELWQRYLAMLIDGLPSARPGALPARGRHPLAS